MSKRYFINNFDSIVGKAIFNELVKPGEQVEDGVHMATYMDRTQTEKPQGIKKILKREKPQLSRKKMLEECDVYVYDILFGDKDNIISDVNYLKSIFLDPNPPAVEEPQTLILISDVMSWSDSGKKVKPEQPPGDPEGGEEGGVPEQQKQEGQPQGGEEGAPDPEAAEGAEGAETDIQDAQKQVDASKVEEEQPVQYVAWEETDFQMRKALEKYQYMKDLEDLILSLKHQQVKVIIICAGVLYGLGEITFHQHFKAGWLENPEQLPYLGEGNNQVPTIHLTDLAQFVVKVAESPPELNYLFAFDNSPDRTQQGIVNSISQGVGSRKIQSVESSPLIQDQFIDVFQLDLWARNSSLLLGTQENPVEFEWQFQKGLIGNTYKVLQQFWKTQKLRPLQILAFTPPAERSLPDSQYNWILEKISEHYRIPVIKIKDVIEHCSLSLEGQLGTDLREELEKIQEYFAEGQQRQMEKPILETLKVLYRVVKWRLSQNDCMNRGYILDSYPLFVEEAKVIFYPQQNQLKRIQPQPKKVKGKQAPEDGEAQPQGGEEGGEPVEGGVENEAPADGAGEEQAPVEGGEENKEDEENPEDQNPPEEEGGGEEDENAPKVEFFHPESFIFIKKLAQNRQQTPENDVFNYFSQQGEENMVFDASKQEEFEIFENLRIYIERNGRPFNYLVPEETLKMEHIQFFDQRNNQISQQKIQKQQEETKQIQSIQEKREGVAKQEISNILNQENDVEVIQRMPFRNYLMEYVVPQLNEGLLEAQYLFKKSFDFT